jgi:hypothetical protein
MMTTAVISTVVTSSLSFAADTASVPYPQGYRDWHHVKSMVINPGHGLYDAFGGIHHLYANKAAMQGYNSGKWADGAVIVFDLLEARTADNTVTPSCFSCHKSHGNQNGFGLIFMAGTGTVTEEGDGGVYKSLCKQCHVQG